MSFNFKSSAAVAAALLALFAGTEGPSARAFAADAPVSKPHAEAALTQEVVPVFVAKEVVQPLPATADEAEEISPAPSLSALIARTDLSAPLDAELECLAGAVYFESRGEPLAGQLAVAQVVINRAASGRFPTTYCGVVRQAGQFSFVKRGHIPQPSVGSAAWRNARAIARIAHAGSYESAAADSLYFHAASVNPKWGKRRVATISSHTFYR